MWASRGWLQCGVNLLRPMRPGEKHGVDYFFVSKEQFEEWIETGELCEWALVYGEYKGIPKSQVCYQTCILSSQANAQPLRCTASCSIRTFCHSPCLNCSRY